MWSIGFYRFLGTQHLDEICQRHGFGDCFAPFIERVSNRQRVVGRQIGNAVFRKNPIHCLFISLRRIRPFGNAESAYLVINSVCRVFLRRIYKARFCYFVTVRDCLNQP